MKISEQGWYSTLHSEAKWDLKSRRPISMRSNQCRVRSIFSEGDDILSYTVHTGINQSSIKAVLRARNSFNWDETLIRIYILRVILNGFYGTGYNTSKNYFRIRPDLLKCWKAGWLLPGLNLISSGDVVTGFSMATRQRICRRWFCITSLGIGFGKGPYFCHIKQSKPYSKQKYSPFPAFFGFRRTDNLKQTQKISYTK